MYDRNEYLFSLDRNNNFLINTDRQPKKINTLGSRQPKSRYFYLYLLKQTTPTSQKMTYTDYILFGTKRQS